MGAGVMFLVFKPLPPQCADISTSIVTKRINERTVKETTRKKANINEREVENFQK